MFFAGEGGGCPGEGVCFDREGGEYGFKGDKGGGGGILFGGFKLDEWMGGTVCTGAAGPSA